MSRLSRLSRSSGSKRLNFISPRRRSRKRRGLSYLVALALTVGLTASTGYFFLGNGKGGDLPFAKWLSDLPNLPDFSKIPQFSAFSQGASVPEAGKWQVYFSPNGGATHAIVQEIGRAKQRIRVQAYSFTSAPIAKALAAAHARGVDVQVILDKSQRSERYTSATYLANRKVLVLIDAAHAIAHDKVMILDGVTVITGSFNFTKSAEERNSENLLILHQATAIAAEYEKHWVRHAAHSRPYERASETSAAASSGAPQRWRPPGVR